MEFYVTFKPYSENMFHPEFNIYRSSAGSGKTQTLAKEYLKLILSGRSDFRHVLAITFTNKAAWEMKERVLKLLQQLGSEEELTGALLELSEEIVVTSGRTKEEIRMEAKRTHMAILHHYSDFNIGTIDSFVHRIIRSFALELNLSFSFELELEMDLFVETVIDDLLEKAGEDKELTQSLVVFLRSLLEDEKSWNIEQALQSFTKFLTEERSITPLEKLMKATSIDICEVITANRRASEDIREEWNALLLQADQKIKDSGIPADAFSFKEGGIYSFFRRCIEKQDYLRLYKRSEKSDRYLQYMEEGKDFWSARTEASLQRRFSALSTDLVKIWNDLTRLVDRRYPEYNLRRLVHQKLNDLSLGRAIRENMLSVMAHDNIIPISEFNRLIWNIVRTQPVPFIYERTSELYNHFLVDEFQDTSEMQWFNLLPLVDNALAQGGMSMVVGDAKQAIYRWRNGDVWQFVKLPEIRGSDGEPLLRERQEALKRYAGIRQLKYNYRSSIQIIDFNNRFFGWLKGTFPGSLEQIYELHEQLPGTDAPDGLVEIHLVPEVTGEKVAYYDGLYAEITRDKVQALLADQEAGIRPGDICILVRRHKEAAIVASCLLNAGIDVVSAESFRLDSFPEPVFLRAVAGLLFNKLDAIQATVMATQLYHAGRITLEQLHQVLFKLGGAVKLKQSLHPWADALFALTGVQRMIGTYAPLPLYEMCEQVIRDFYGSHATPAAVQYLLDITALFVQGSGNNTTAYLQHLDDKLKTSVPLPETTHAVRIITIHKAKGLQFPVVIYPFAHESDVQPNRNTKLLWIDDPDQPLFKGLPVMLVPGKPDLADTMYRDLWENEKNAEIQDAANLVYVAFTRAVKRLYIISAPRRYKQKSEFHLYDLLTSFIKESDMFRSEDEVVFTFGKPMCVRQKDAGENPLFRLAGWESYDWTDRIGLRAGNRLAGYAESRQQAVTRGLLLHAILSEAASPEDLNRLLDEYEDSGLIRKEETDELLEMLTHVMDIEEVKPFFDPAVRKRSESVLITPEGKIFRPDKVIEMQDHAAVLDFKTGKPHDSHHRQVVNYKQILLAMGYKSVRGYLLYLDQKELVEV